MRHVGEPEGEIPQNITSEPSGSPFVPGDLVLVKNTSQQGTITRIPSQYNSEVHVNGWMMMIPNEWTKGCESKSSVYKHRGTEEK